MPLDDDLDFDDLDLPFDSVVVAATGAGAGTGAIDAGATTGADGGVGSGTEADLDDAAPALAELAALASDSLLVYVRAK